MQISNVLSRLTLTEFEERFADRHLLHGTVEKWAEERSEAIALIDFDRRRNTTWAEFDCAATGVAMRLLEAGFRKGDSFASLLPLTSHHLFLEYACFKIGVIFVPLDLRLPPAEILRSLTLVRAKGFAFLKMQGAPDVAPMLGQLQQAFNPKMVIQFSAPGVETTAGTVNIVELLGDAMQLAKPSCTNERSARLRAMYAEASRQVTENDGALVIFTTGSTGSPKPALLSHRNISCQAMCISQTLLHGTEKPLVTLVNLPPSHVGCQTELLMGTLFEGGTAVLLAIFEPTKTLQAISDSKVTALGQIPAMFQFEWRLKDYDTFDLSSLELAVYGGQSVTPAFIDKMATMAPEVGTGLGLTETAGFCTYIRVPREQARAYARSVGFAAPIYDVTIRQAMRADRSAGDELPPGDVGYVCFRGPQTFLGYLNDPVATATTLSTDGYLYTGDMGRVEANGLHLSGRAKFIIKPGGYQVFPGDVEAHFSAMEEVAEAVAVGVEHPIISEAIVLFVEAKPGTELTIAALQRHARSLASYMRPRHYVILQPGELPLNRVAKADYLALRDRAKQEVQALKARGTWDEAE
ncbi:MAG TPA: class I adenylate-forming enzyme family protein [Candidatus Acidoferrales bacterium]|nr:class I adenylate-forming enzyme family protein [Candidatus Acidoferrales bacterium]